ncbi:Uncharacterized protein dnl_36690 [Desulfonema limicola]|uniref:Uncharacterized protein n=1 Tax=Desulfonema limicola TaxID=45656 RepID=A0A975B9J3_9BACT|nr:Uncharacterized protein dnl_36690 [Desulfonema limicola]
MGTTLLYIFEYFGKIIFWRMLNKELDLQIFFWFIGLLLVVLNLSKVSLKN